MMKILDRPFLAAIACVSMLFGAHAVATADDASRWDGDARSGVRLIAASRPAGETAAPLRAGVEIRLQKGWHTYWRYPGDSGIPPQFDFSRSDNVREVEVLWPAPKRLPEAGNISIGYDRDVILPLRVTTRDPGKPVTLRLKLDYAICEKLCVPAEARAELALAPLRSAFDVPLAAAEARVPRKLSLGEGRTISVRSLRREDEAGKARIVVDVAAADPVELFAEGPTPQWALPVPAPADGAPPGQRRFTFALDGAPSGVSYQGAMITLTAVGAREAIQVSSRLD